MKKTKKDLKTQKPDVNQMLREPHNSDVNQSHLESQEKTVFNMIETNINLKKKLHQTAFILDTKPYTRGDDRLLTMMFWWKFDGLHKYFKEMNDAEFKEFWETLRKCTSPETITRCRRKLNEMGMYLPTDATILKRRLRETSIRENINDL